VFEGENWSLFDRSATQHLVTDSVRVGGVVLAWWGKAVK
jgi:hypothetical protein